MDNTHNLVLSEEMILSKLVLIEKYLHKNNYVFYEPSKTFDSHDIIAVQREATLMMNFVGLSKYTAVVTFVDAIQNQGGNIDLDNSENVFIQVNKNYQGDDNKVLGILSHEICHKLLYVNGLFSPIEIENEILTDLATIYVGFGKLSLNGCYDRKDNSNWDVEWDWGTVKIKKDSNLEIQKLGYLSLAQFSVAYNIMCRLHNIPKKEKLQGLTKFALKQVSSTILYSSISQIDKKTLKNKLREIQQTDAQVANAIIIIEGLISQLQTTLKQHHIKYNQEMVKPFDLGQESDMLDNPLAANEIMNKYSKFENSLKEQNIVLQRFIRQYPNDEEDNPIVEIAPNLLNIECPHCGDKKRGAINEYKECFLKCKKCGYLFVWDAQKHYLKKSILGKLL